MSSTSRKPSREGRHTSSRPSIATIPSTTRSNSPVPQQRQTSERRGSSRQVDLGQESRRDLSGRRPKNVNSKHSVHCASSRPSNSRDFGRSRERSSGTRVRSRTPSPSSSKRQVRSPKPSVTSSKALLKSENKEKLDKAVKQLFFHKDSLESVATEDENLKNYLTRRKDKESARKSMVVEDDDVVANPVGNLLPGSNRRVNIAYMSERVPPWRASVDENETAFKAPALPRGMVIHAQHPGVLLDDVDAHKDKSIDMLQFDDTDDKIKKTYYDMQFEMRRSTEEQIRGFETKIKEMCDDVKSECMLERNVRLSELYRREDWEHEVFNPKGKGRKGG